jgi:hypothetical protein
MTAPLPRSKGDQLTVPRQPSTAPPVPVSLHYKPLVRPRPKSRTILQPVITPIGRRHWGAQVTQSPGDRPQLPAERLTLISVGRSRSTGLTTLHELAEELPHAPGNASSRPASKLFCAASRQQNPERIHATGVGVPAVTHDDQDEVSVGDWIPTNSVSRGRARTPPSLRPRSSRPRRRCRCRPSRRRSSRCRSSRCHSSRPRSPP